MTEQQGTPEPSEQPPGLVEVEVGTDAPVTPLGHLHDHAPPVEPPKRPATALDRTRLAVQRDESARRRDLSAIARDRSADARDRAAARRESTLPTPDAGRRVERALSGLRSAAALDRAAAAADRERAAADREAAAIDRRQFRVDLTRAHLDDLTGVYSRGLGHETLRNEVARAHRVGHPFTLAFLDVDGLKTLNDSAGHAAGDDFLRAVAAAIRTKLRSYDPVVRVGGDEFVCGFADTGIEAARRRVIEMRAALAQTHPDRSFSTGIAELQARETLDQLLERGDQALYRAKQARRGY